MAELKSDAGGDLKWSYGMSGERLSKALREWLVLRQSGELYQMMNSSGEDIRRILAALGVGIGRRIYTKGGIAALKSSARVFWSVSATKLWRFFHATRVNIGSTRTFQKMKWQSREAPLVDVAKANHHAHCTMPLPLVRALHPRVVLGSVWSRLHSQRSVLRNFVKARAPFLYVPGFMPKRPEDAGEGWLDAVAEECYNGVHAVVDVQPDARKYRLMLVDAQCEDWRIVGAYDFSTYHKGVE